MVLERPSFKGTAFSNREISALEIPQPINPVDFVEKIRLPLQSGDIQQTIDLTLTPYLVKPVETLADYTVKMIFIVACTQSGKTVVAQIDFAYSIDQDPGPMLVIMPDENSVKNVFRVKYRALLNSTPCLRMQKTGNKKDVSDKGIRLKRMTVDIAWSNSPSKMNSLPKKRVIWDEARLMGLTTRGGSESNAIKLGEDRMTIFRDAGVAQGLVVSSPSVKGDLLHQQLDVPDTLVLFWHVPCPVCGRYQLLDFFKNIHRVDGDNQNIKCICAFEDCDGEFTDSDRKREWNNKGVYAPEGADIENSGMVVSDVPKYDRIVFWWSSLESPFRSWQAIWDEFKRTKDKPHDYKNFWQCWLARFWEEARTRNSVETLEERKGEYLQYEVPENTKVLLGGLDTQDGAIYFVVYAFTYHPIKKEVHIYLIDEDEVMCDIAITDEEDLILLAREHLHDKIYVHRDGTEWKVMLAGWDSGGHRTKEIYAACSKLPRIVAVKGRNRLNRRIQYSTKDTHYNVKTIEYLEETDEIAAGNRFHLPKNVSQQFVKQFCSVGKVEKQNRKTGAIEIEWRVKGANHLRDATCYCFACLDIPIGRIGKGFSTIRDKLKVEGFKLNPVEIERRRKLPVGKNKPGNEVIQDDKAKAQAARRIEQNRERNSWMGNRGGGRWI